MSRETPKRESTKYTGAAVNPELRAYRDDVLKHIGYEGRKKVGDGGPLVDVRSPGEYSGELLHMPDYPQEGAMRGGHIPGAANIPWAQAVAEDGTPLGTVLSIEEYGAGPFLVIQGEGGERLVPFTRSAVPMVDLAAGRITLVPPPEVTVQPPPGEEHAA